ncbi:alpha/beta fold hydrolase [uncultured Roseobacter sp.]|uniref:alpha/beta hydrolase family protein n=1 Tax=uncultured Roseobacter sp. TaxID=114847 RepID=UPI002607B69E|nr:alpha/beta fold hydrolase [uncultured Roseobacter sp.]
MGGTLYTAGAQAPFVIVNGATGVPHSFYRRFAAHSQQAGFSVLTFDYRGVGASAPKDLRGFSAQVSDWGLMDMQAAVNFVESTCTPDALYIVGHSAGGQQAGMIRSPDKIAAMVTMSSQSGYWRLQGGWEKPKVWFFVTVFIPMLTRLFGYFPWRYFGGEDLPYHVALGWAAWCRSPGYLLDDARLPLHRFREFGSPVLACSIDDDNWGTRAAVEAMMSAYPNVEFRHLIPSEYGLTRLGHMGFFRKGSEALWDETLRWLQQAHRR